MCLNIVVVHLKFYLFTLFSMFSLVFHRIKQSLVGGIFLFFWVSLTFAAPVRFDISVSPNPIKVSEFADVTIKALDENDNVDTSYTEDIWIEVENMDYTDPDLVLPGGGVWLFEAADQWIKIFSKWLSIKKPGTYTLTVADVYDTNLKWTTEFTVLSDSGGPAVSDISLVSPVSGSIEKWLTVDVIGSTSIPNIPIEIFIDGSSIQEGISDDQGSFTLTLSDLEAGEHILKVNALDLDDKVVATTGEVPFSYVPDENQLAMHLTIEPGNTVFVDEKITFTVTTAERVTSVFLKLSDHDEVPMEKVKAGEFTKTMSLSEVGSYPVHVRLVVTGNSTDFKNVDTVTVKEEIRKILDLNYTTNDERTKADLTWTYTGTIDYFKVKYGTNKDNLRLSITTTNPKGMLVLAEPTIPYYVQVFPVDKDGGVNGDPSDIVTIDPLVVETPVCGDGKREWAEACDDGNILNGDGCSSVCIIEVAPTCYPDGIDLKTKKVHGKRYLYRDPVPGALEYTIYRADQAVSSTKQMSVVGKTTETMFLYPFDKNSEIDKWAWYAVEATCPDHTQKPVGDVTAVKVWPKDTLMMIFFWALIVFMWWRLAKISR